jgi:hypothetical protein
MPTCGQIGRAAANEGRDTLVIHCWLGHKSIMSTAVETARAEPVQGLLAVADMGISQRELEAARTARAVRTARADARASELAGTIKHIQASCVTTLLGIAAELNRHGIPTATGRGKWCGTRVRRMLARL